MTDQATLITQGTPALTQNGETILETALTGELLLEISAAEQRERVHHR